MKTKTIQTIYALWTEWDGILGYFDNKETALKIAEKVFNNNTPEDTSDTLEDWLEQEIMSIHDEYVEGEDTSDD